MGKQLGLTNEQMKRMRIAAKSYPAGQEREEAFKKIFTPEQRAKYEAYLKSKRQHQH